MKISLLTALLFAFAVIDVQLTHAQGTGVYLSDVSGFPIRPATSNGEVSGTPFLNREWQLASVKLKSGKTYKNMHLKLNLLDHNFVFEGDAGQTMGFTEPVESVIFDATMSHESPMVFRSGFKGGVVKETDFLEVIADGSAQALKMTSIAVKEVKDYGSAVTEKSYVTKSAYYINKKDKTLQTISLNKKDISKVLADHSKEVELFISENKLNFKKDEDLRSVMHYYNSL